MLPWARSRWWTYGDWSKTANRQEMERIYFMKRIICWTLLCMLLLTACGNGQSAQEPDQPKVIDIAAALETLNGVNPVENPRTIDDFSLENELMVDPELVESYSGIVTNNQADCALNLVIQAKPDQAAKVEEALTKYKTSLSTNTLYVEYAQKTARAQETRITRCGDYVLLCMGGVGLKDMSGIDGALAQLTK